MTKQRMLLVIANQTPGFDPKDLYGKRSKPTPISLPLSSTPIP